MDLDPRNTKSSALARHSATALFWTAWVTSSAVCAPGSGSKMAPQMGPEWPPKWSQNGPQRGPKRGPEGVREGSCESDPFCTPFRALLGPSWARIGGILGGSWEGLGAHLGLLGGTFLKHIFKVGSGRASGAILAPFGAPNRAQDGSGGALEMGSNAKGRKC